MFYFLSCQPIANTTDLHYARDKDISVEMLSPNEPGRDFPYLTQMFNSYTFILTFMESKWLYLIDRGVGVHFVNDCAMIIFRDKRGHILLTNLLKVRTGIFRETVRVDRCNSCSTAVNGRTSRRKVICKASVYLVHETSGSYLHAYSSTRRSWSLEILKTQ